MMNGRPVGVRKRIQYLVILAILAWATQLLVQQWGYGQDVAAGAARAADASDDPAQPVDPVENPSTPPAMADEKFVPADVRSGPGATLELRGEATVVGAEVKLKQICRWSDGDAAVFAPVADLVLTRFPGQAAFKAVGIEEIKSTLHDAGVNLAVIHFSGPMTCTVSRSDVEFDEGAALQQWIDARKGTDVADAAPAPSPATTDTIETTTSAKPESSPVASSDSPKSAPRDPAPAPAPDEAPAAAVGSPFHRLRELLTADVAERLNLPIDQLQLSFNDRDERVLNLAEPQFRFQIDPRRVKNLGPVAWEVTIVTDAGSRKVVVSGTARAWQRQVVVNKPLAYRQVIRDQDVSERRTLVDRLPDQPLLERPQAVAQQAARDLKPGTVLTARMVDAVPLAKPGQFITVTLVRGTVKVKTVGRALEGGSFGQTIRVKNEATRDVYEVVLTAPQEATMGTEEKAPEKLAEKSEDKGGDTKIASISGD